VIEQEPVFTEEQLMEILEGKALDNGQDINADGCR
jgi:hypothetical protein